MFKFLKKLNARIRYDEAVNKANKAFEKTGNRQFVIPMQNGKALIVDRNNFRELKRKGYIGKNYTINDCMINAFYRTPLPNGTQAMTDEQIQRGMERFINWTTR